MDCLEELGRATPPLHYIIRGDIVERLMELIGEYCREHRINTLGLNLTHFSELCGQNLKNIHAFEKGRANNIKYLFCYYIMTDVDGRERFLTGLFELYKEVDNKWK